MHIDITAFNAKINIPLFLADTEVGYVVDVMQKEPTEEHRAKYSPIGTVVKLVMREKLKVNPNPRTL